jgi:hypothetical protein
MGTFVAPFTGDVAVTVGDEAGERVVVVKVHT